VWTASNTYPFLAVAVLKDWDIHNIDIKTAYLYGNLNEKYIWSSLKILSYLVKKKKSSNSVKHCIVLSKLVYLCCRL